jgi:serine/threonine-protein kinase
VSLDGGPATVLASSVGVPFGASWGSDGYIAFSSGFDAGLYRVRSEGGTAETLTTRLPGDFHHRLPHYLPRSKGVLFTVAGRPGDPHPRTAVVDEAQRTHTLLEDAADARYVAPGYLVFVRQGSLMAVRFDLDRLRTTGQAIPLDIGVAQAMNVPATTEETDAGQFAVSGAGALVYAAGGTVPDEQHSLVWVEQDGREAGLAVPFTAPFLAARLSPDGKRIAYTLTGTKKQVWVYDVNGGGPSALTSEGRVNFAIWTPDSQQVVFGWSASGPPNLFARPVDQSAPPQALTADKTCVGQGPGSFSPDGNLLAFWRQFPDRQQILILDRRSGLAAPFIEGRPGESLFFPEFSPDGRWLAYTSDESGRREVYVRAFPRGGKWTISSEGGTEPLWARDGRRLFYRSGTQVWAVDLGAAAGLRREKPRSLFSQADKYVSNAPGRAWDLSFDGRRFLMLKREATPPQPVTRLAFVQSWTTELQRLFETRERER